MSKVISFVLYYNKEYLLGHTRFILEYLSGLVLNAINIADKLPDWEMWVYVDTTAWDHQLCRMIVKWLLKKGLIKMKLIEDISVNRMTSRYSPAYDPNVEITVVRDIDSVMTDLDFELIKEWENRDERVLRYHEYKMGEGWCMGGGFGVKGTIKKMESSSKYCFQRNEDEPFLKRTIDYNEISLDQMWTIYTRMNVKGSYFRTDMYGKIHDENNQLLGNPFWYGPEGDPDKWLIEAETLISYQWLTTLLLFSPSSLSSSRMKMHESPFSR